MVLHSIVHETLDVQEFRKNPNKYFTCLSVEVGNTTVKTILTATEFPSKKTYLLEKGVSMTRDVDDGNDFKTVLGKNLGTSELSDYISDAIRKTFFNLRLNTKDLDFAVRSTGIVAGMDNSKDLDNIIISLANGCLNTGIPSKKMIQDIPESLKKYSVYDKLPFDGYVANVMPDSVTANSMESDLVVAGLKDAISFEVNKSNKQFQQCVFGSDSYIDSGIFIDGGTTLAGKVIDDNMTKVCFVGLYGGIFDALVSSIATDDYPSVMDLGELESGDADYLNEGSLDFSSKLMDYISVGSVNKDVCGMVPVYLDKAKEQDIEIIGIDVGINGSDLRKISDIGRDLFETYGQKAIYDTIDNTSAILIDVLVTESKKYIDSYILGLTGRAAIEGNKLDIVDAMLDGYEVYAVEDGLALGASMMARCVNSLCKPKCLVGGSSCFSRRENKLF
ncbi:MAG: methanogenesis marker 14 protein [DPANN group archaeon]|nr:methanogenesis marker 14 protein [DPANN group archaeon]